MSLTFVVDTIPPLVRVYGVGALTLDDIQNLVNDLTTAGVYTLPRLVDLRQATTHVPAVKVQEAVYLQTKHQIQHGAVRVAVVVLDPASYGLLRMYQFLNWEHDPDFGVFRTLPEAMDWLQINTAHPSILPSSFHRGHD